MVEYEWRCRECSLVFINMERDYQNRAGCPHCGGPVKRVYSVTVPGVNTGIEPHFNHSLGEVVNSWSDYQSKLTRKAEQQSELTGIPVKYSPIHPADFTANNVGVTSEGID